ncbi:MAG: hypothetical protein WHT06_02485 [Desulfobacterales bacterium]
MATIACSRCNSRFKLPEGKPLPAGPGGALPCPRCGTPIALGAAPAPAGGESIVSLREIDPGAYNDADRPFDFIEEEGKTALLCEQHPLLKKPILECLQQMEYQITVADNAREALKRMRYHTYDVVVVDEEFDTDDPETNGVLLFLERLGMASRRNMYVVLLSNRHRTMDNMTAFLKSVNLIVNAKNIEDFPKILNRGLTDHLAFYRIFREKLKETGRA